MKEKLSNRAKQAIATKEKLYKTGIRLFKERGYENITAEDITKEAEVSIGTFYRYYESKMALYLEMFIHAEDYFEEFQNPDYQKLDIKTMLLNFFCQYVKLNVSCGIEFTGDIISPGNRKFLGGNQKFEEDVVRIVEHYQSTGEFPKEHTANDISDMLFLIARGVLLDWCLKNGNIPLEDRMNEAIGMILDAYMINQTHHE